MKIKKLALLGVIFFILPAVITFCPFKTKAAYYDAGVTKLNLSSQPFYVNEQVRISPVLKNYGTMAGTYYLDIEVRDRNNRLDYSSRVKIYNLSPGSTKTVNFYWYPARAGDYSFCFFTYDSSHIINYESNYYEWYRVYERTSAINNYSFTPSSLQIEKGDSATITTRIGITAYSDGYLQAYFNGSGIDKMAGKYISSGSQYVDISVTIPSSQLSTIKSYQPKVYIQFRPHEIYGPLLSSQASDVIRDVSGPVITVVNPIPKVLSTSVTNWNNNSKTQFNPNEEIRFHAYLTAGADPLTINWQTYGPDNNYVAELSYSYRQTGHPEYTHYWLDNKIPNTLKAGIYRVKTQVGASYKEMTFEVLPRVSIEGATFSPINQRINLGDPATVNIRVYLTSNTAGYLQLNLYGQGVSQVAGGYNSFIGSYYSDFNFIIPASQLTQEQLYNPSLYIQFRPYVASGPLTDTRPGDITQTLAGPSIEVMGRHSVELSVSNGTKCLDLWLFDYCYLDWKSDLTYYGGKAAFTLSIKNTGTKREKFRLIGDGIPENNPIPPTSDTGYLEVELNPGESRAVDAFPIGQDVGGVRTAQWWVTYNNIELARATHNVMTVSWAEYVAFLVSNDPSKPQILNELKAKIMGNVLSLFTDSVETLTKDDMNCLRYGNLMLDDCAEATGTTMLVFIPMPVSGGAGAAEKAIVSVGDESAEISIQAVRKSAAKTGLIDDVMGMITRMKNRVINAFKREIPELSSLGDDAATRFVERYYGTAEQKILTSVQKILQNKAVSPQAVGKIIENPGFTDRALYQFFQDLEKFASSKGVEKFINTVSQGGFGVDDALFSANRMASFADNGVLREIEKSFTVVFDNGAAKIGSVDTLTDEGGKVVVNEIKKINVAGRDLGPDGFDLLDNGLIDQLDKYKELIRKGGTSEGLYFKPDKVRLIVEDVTPDGLKALQEKYGAVLEASQTGRKTYLLFALPYQVKTPPQIATNNGQDFSTNKSSVVIEGTIENYFTGLLVNGVNTGISWSDSTHWRYTARLTTGDNRFEFVATKNNFRSNARILNIKYDTIAPNINFSPPAGIFNSAISVSISCDEEASIYYTLDGRTPTISSARYSNPINISTDSTIIALAIDKAGNQRISGQNTYRIITGAPSPPIITSISGGYAGRTSSRTIYGSKLKDTAIWINGREAIINNTQTSWSYAVTLNEGNNVIDIFCSNLAGTESSHVTIILILDTTPPLITLNPLPGTYSLKPLVITITINEEGEIYYSYDGVMYYRYSQPLSITTTKTIRYYARDKYANRSSIFSAKYTLTN